MGEMIPQEVVEQKIFVIRGHKDFMFQLTEEEFKNLMFHFGTSSWGGTRKMPRAFTEHGILMLSSVLKSERAVQVNIQIMRTFVRLRRVSCFVAMPRNLVISIRETYLGLDRVDY